MFLLLMFLGVQAQCFVSPREAIGKWPGRFPGGTQHFGIVQERIQKMLHLPHSPEAVNSPEPIPAKRASALALLKPSHILVSFFIVSIVPSITETIVSQSREILTFSN